jgi:hypothetical protein
LNTLQGYAISILLFFIGIAIPGPATVSNTKPSETTIAAAPRVRVVNPTEGVNELAFDVKYPPVRTDHPGRRKQVPKDPEQRCPEFEDDFVQYGLYPIETWSYIAYRESRCNPEAQNARWDENGNMTYALNKDGSYDTGLVQINSSWRSRIIEVCGKWAVRNHMQGLKTLDCNLKMARFIMNESAGGLSNWRM